MPEGTTLSGNCPDLFTNNPGKHKPNIRKRRQELKLQGKIPMKPGFVLLELIPKSKKDDNTLLEKMQQNAADYTGIMKDGR